MRLFSLLLLVFAALARGGPSPSGSVPPARRPQEPSPPPPSPPRRLPDHYGWCLLAERYAHKWELTYDYDAVMPYRARHRGQPDLVFAATDRELFEVMLSVAEPPSRVRRYVVEAEERQRAEELAALNDLVFMAPGGAW